MKKIKDPNHLLIFSIVILSIIIGFYFRLKNLGLWPIAIDEYYILKSVENIIGSGLPEFQFGGYYTRGLIYQYLIASGVFAGLDAEYFSRFISVLANIAAIPAIYLIAKRFKSIFVIAAAIILFSLSLWELEFSRFARMYTMFQTLFLWYLYFFVRYYLDNKSSAYNYCLILSFIGIFVYEAAIFLILLNFLPFILKIEEGRFKFSNFNKIRENGVKAMFSVLVLISAVVFIKYDFRTLNAPNLLPPDLISYFNQSEGKTLLRLPTTIFSNFDFNIISILSISILLLANFYAIKLILHFRELSNETKFSMFLILGLVLLGLYGLALYTTLILLLLGWFSKSLIENKKILFILGILSLNLIISFTLLFNNNFDQSSHSLVGFLKETVKAQLNYPYLYEIFAVFRDTLPKLTVVSYLLILISIFLLIYKEKEIQIRFFHSIFLLCVLMVSFINTTYFDTRYMFFIFPLFLILLAYSLYNLVVTLLRNQKIIGWSLSILLIVLIIFSEDTDFNHLVNVDKKEINFRSNYALPLEVHYYPRWDSKSLAEIVNREADQDDIIVTNEYTSDYYLNRLDYIYKSYKSKEFKIISVNNGKQGRWTEANLIYKFSDLERILNNDNGVVWFIMNSTWGKKEFEESGFFKNNKASLYRTGKCNKTFLYKLTKNKSMAKK